MWECYKCGLKSEKETSESNGCKHQWLDEQDLAKINRVIFAFNDELQNTQGGQKKLKGEAGWSWLNGGNDLENDVAACWLNSSFGKSWLAGEYGKQYLSYLKEKEGSVEEESEWQDDDNDLSWLDEPVLKEPVHNYGSFTDPRDGKIYKTIEIGDQIWMAENLKYDIPGSKCYDDNPKNALIYGRLYDFDAAKNACPPGWHLPSNEEWEKLINFAGGKENGIGVDEEGIRQKSWDSVGNQLKTTSGWKSNGFSGNGSNILGFSAKPAGFRYFSGREGETYLYKSVHIGDVACWWSASMDGDWENNIKANICEDNVYYFSLYCEHNCMEKLKEIYYNSIMYADKTMIFVSVRYIKDKSPVKKENIQRAVQQTSNTSSTSTNDSLQGFGTITDYNSEKRSKSSRIGYLIAFIIAICVAVYFFTKDSTVDEILFESTGTLMPIEITNQDMYYIPARDNNGFHKYITLDGKSVTEAKYLRAYVFKNGIALVQEKDSSWSYIDTKGNYIANGYTQGLSFNDGIAWVNDNGVIKAINTNGNILVSLPQEVISVWSFYNNLALFSAHGMQNYLDKNFNAVSEEYYADGNRFQENMASVMCDNGKYRYIDKAMRSITNCSFDEAKVFKNSRAAVRVGKGWGIINKQGMYVLQPSNDIEAIVYDEDMFRYKQKDANWGWLNSEGQVAIQPNFAETMSFGNRDIAPVMQNALWGYIDKNGEYVINSQYKAAYPFVNNRAFVKSEDGNFATIDRNGKKDLQTNYQRLDNSYLEMLNSGVTSEPRIMTIKPKKFNCDKPNNNERAVARMICKSYYFINSDNEISEWYADKKNSYVVEADFLAERNGCKDVSCLQRVYENMISIIIQFAEMEAGI